MKDILRNAEDILNQNISGFHQYVLTEPVHVNYVSRNFCEMTGVVEEEICNPDKDLYELFSLSG